jgi:hypothetical protein
VPPYVQPQSPIPLFTTLYPFDESAITPSCGLARTLDFPNAAGLQRGC